LAQNEQTQTQTVTINGKHYLLDSFKDEQKIALVQIEQIDAEKELLAMKLRNLDYAKQFLVEYLSKNADKLQEAPEAPEAPKEA
jgi:hypothetical protein